MRLSHALECNALHAPFSCSSVHCTVKESVENAIDLQCQQHSVFASRAHRRVTLQFTCTAMTDTVMLNHTNLRAASLLAQVNDVTSAMHVTCGFTQLSSGLVARWTHGKWCSVEAK